MTKEEVFAIKPVPRLELVDDIQSKQADNHKHRIGWGADSALLRESGRMEFSGITAARLKLIPNKLHTRLFAITAAAARPPIRDCKIRIRLVLEIGYTTRKLVRVGRAQLLASRIMAIKAQTRIVRICKPLISTMRSQGVRNIEQRSWRINA